MTNKRIKSPLAGLRLLNTRPKEQSRLLSGLLEQFGAEIVEQPALEILPAESLSELPGQVTTLNEGDWLLFTSANGVRIAIEYLQTQFGQPKFRDLISKLRFAVIGKKTGVALEFFGIKPTFVATEANVESFGGEFRRLLLREVGEGKVCNLLFLCAKLARKKWLDSLTIPGVSSRTLVVYDAVCPAVSQSSIKDLRNQLGLAQDKFQDGSSKLDMLIFTSAQAVKNFCSMLGGTWEELALLSSIPVSVIGPGTAQTVRELGLNLVIVAENRSVESLVEGILDYYTDEYMFTDQEANT